MIDSVQGQTPETLLSALYSGLAAGIVAGVVVGVVAVWLVSLLYGGEA